MEQEPGYGGKCILECLDPSASRGLVRPIYPLEKIWKKMYMPPSGYHMVNSYSNLTLSCTPLPAHRTVNIVDIYFLEQNYFVIVVFIT